MDSITKKLSVFPFPKIISVLLFLYFLLVLFWRFSKGTVDIYDFTFVPLFIGVIFLFMSVVNGHNYKFSSPVVTTWILATIFFPFSLYLPNRIPDIIWQKGDRVAESMWTWPVSEIRVIPLVYHTREKSDWVEVDLIFIPLRNRAPDYDPEDVRRVLREFVQEQIIATASFPKIERIEKLEKRLHSLPSGLEGEVSGTLKFIIKITP